MTRNIALGFYFGKLEVPITPMLEIGNTDEKQERVMTGIVEAADSLLS
jgi:hypothetical protein